jgi:hypothetical protein
MISEDFFFIDLQARVKHKDFETEKKLIYIFISFNLYQRAIQICRAKFGLEVKLVTLPNNQINLKVNFSEDRAGLSKM